MKRFKNILKGILLVGLFFVSYKVSHAYIFNNVGGSSSSSSGGVATGTVISVGSPLTVGGSATTTIDGNGGTSVFGGPINSLTTSSPSVIQNFDNILYVPYNYNTSTYGEFSAYILAWYNQQVSLGYHGVGIVIPPTGIPNGNWFGTIDFEATSTSVLIRCEGNASINYNGTSTGFIFNPGTVSKNWLSGIDGCYSDGHRRDTTTFAIAGGSNGDYGARFTNNLIRDWNIGIVPANNAPMPYVGYNTFEGVNQPIDYDFSVTTNNGENPMLEHNVFSGCNQPGITPYQAIYLKNSSGALLNGNSYDDCFVYLDTSNFGTTFIGGWFENPAANTNQVGSSTAYITIASDNKTSVSIHGTTFSSGVQTSTNAVPPSFIDMLGGGTLSVFGASAYTIGNATSVPMFVQGSSQSNTLICGFLNGNEGGSNNGVLNIINGNTNNNLDAAADSGLMCLNQAGNGYAYAQYVRANILKQYFGNTVYERTDSNQNGTAASVTNYFGSDRQGTSTVDIGNTLGLSVSKYSATTTLSQNAASNSVVYQFTGTIAGTNLILAAVNNTQYRTHIIQNLSNVNTVIAATSTDFILDNTTSTTFTLVPGGSILIEDDGTYWNVLINDNNAPLSGTTSYFPRYDSTGVGLTSTSSLFQGVSNVGIGTITPSSTLEVDATHAFGVGGLVFHAGDSSSSFNGGSGKIDVPFLVSYKAGAATGSLAVFGINAFNNTAGATVPYNSSTNAWVFQQDSRQSAAANLTLNMYAAGSTNGIPSVTHTFFNNGDVSVATTTDFSRLGVNGTFQLVGSSTVITPAIGGAITGGGCDSATTTVDSTITSSTASFITTPTNDPGTTLGGAFFYSFLSSPGLITTRVCAGVTVTPNTTTYVVKIIK